MPPLRIALLALFAMSRTNIGAAECNVTGISTTRFPHPLTLWYDQPATAMPTTNPWMEYSLPIGNGQLGASLLGGILKDEIQFNEKTLWTGGPNDMGEYGQYKNFGSVFVEDISGRFGNTPGTGAKDYFRYLDIEEGICGVHYSSPDSKTTYDRTYLCSYPDNVVAVRYKATGAKRMDLRISIVPGEDIGAVCSIEGKKNPTPGDIKVSGQLTAIAYHAQLRVILPSRGKKIIDTKAHDMTIKGADEVVLLLTAATSYDDAPDNASCTKGNKADLVKMVTERLDRATAKGFESIRAEHVHDFTHFTDRNRLSLKDAASPRPTDRLIDYYNGLTTTDNDEARFLEQLYFAYGRYLEISSSRGVNVPSNLQGIWNNLPKAPWNCDIHTNINVQMNYWPAEVTNLSEMHLPFLNFIIKMSQQSNYRRAATLYGGVKEGWTVFTESNIFGGMSTWGSNYFVANAWYCSHLWQHFRYTRDKEFLERAFPTMWDCAKFWFERLIEDSDGSFVAPDEYSPEQNSHPKEHGTAHSQQLIYDLFASVRQAADILGPDVTKLTPTENEKLDLYLKKTDKGLHTEIYTADNRNSIGWTSPRNGIHKGDTILREWKRATYDASNDPSHRHMSHLMALYPLSEISPSSPYFLPAVNSLRLRGDEATGWSMGWKVCLWARALDGDHAHKILRNALRHSTSYCTKQSAGGVYYNLYDAHAPFQIDGNFGCCAGIAEMLLQSHSDTLQLLPALPSSWRDGKMEGLRAVGDFTVSQTWEKGRLSSAVIISGSGMECPVNYRGIADYKVYCNGEQISPRAIGHNAIVFPTEVGKQYLITL